MQIDESKLIPQIKYFFIDPDCDDAKSYVGLVFHQAFQDKGVPHTLAKVHYGGESGKITIETTVGHTRKVGRALWNAYGRLLRRGGQYPMGYVTRDDEIVDLQVEFQKRQKRKRQQESRRQSTDSEGNSKELKKQSQSSGKSRDNNEDLPQRPTPIRSQAEEENKLAQLQEELGASL